MDDQETTPEEVVEESGAQPALPEEPTQEPAADEATTDEQTTEEPKKPEVDDKLRNFAESRGLKLETESEIKAAKMALENQGDYSRRRQQAAKLEKSMYQQSDAYAEEVATQSGGDPELLKRVNRMEVRDAIRDFWDQNPNARKYEAEIAEKVEQSGLTGSADAVLKAGYAMVIADNQEALKTQGARDALENLANKQRTAVPSGNAVTSNPQTAKITRAKMQEKLQSGDTAWFDKHQAEIDRMVQDGTLV